ncbi:MAG TPA: sigma-70 family RNA polymerase sigma factor [Kofleriaceae bacterium]
MLELASKGDITGALHRLMQRHGAAVYRYSREALRDDALADDVHQQVFTEAFRDLPRFAGRSSVRVWLFAIARHRVLDAVKQRRRTRDRFADLEAVDPPDLGRSAVDMVDDARLYEALAASIAELDEPSRTAVLLRYQQGFTFDDMADICGEKAGTLHARVARALPRLRRAIQARLLGPRGCSKPSPRWRAPQLSLRVLMG